MKQILFQHEISLFHVETCLKQNLFHIITDCIFTNIFLITILLQFFCIKCIFTILLKMLRSFHKFPKKYPFFKCFCKIAEFINLTTAC